MKKHWIIQKRKEKGMNQVELANVCMVSNKTISGIESGKRMPSLFLAYRLAKVLDFDMELFYANEPSA